MKGLKHLDKKGWLSSLFPLLPPEVDFEWHQEEEGTTIYLFTHPILGALGRLSIIPQFKNVQVLWEPVGNYLQPFIDHFLEETTAIVKSPREYHLIPCSRCGLAVGHLLHFPTIQDLTLLKSCAAYHYPNDILLPTWIMGKDIALETLWPMRKLFRAITFEELAASFLEFEVGHCSPLVKSTRLH